MSSDDAEVGFAVQFKLDCPHVVDAFQMTQDQFPSIKASCGTCGDAEENWVCLTCGEVGCSRYRPNKCMTKHVTLEHNCVMSFSDLSCWCTVCEEYVFNVVLEELKSHLYREKFGEDPPNARYLKSSFLNDNNKPTSGDFDPRGVQEGEDVNEYEEDEEQLRENARATAELIRNTDKLVVFTGAGISTSTGIPDYRGPNGLWTLQAQGKAPKMEKKIFEYEPSLTHMAIAELVKRGHCSSVVSTNTDGMHLRSGVPREKLAEMHGNAFKLRCKECEEDLFTNLPVPKHRNGVRNATGLPCPKCNASDAMQGTIIAFGENLYTDVLEKAIEDSEQAEVSLVLGTSMRVQPACSLPTYGDAMVLVNMMKTPYDDKAAVRSFSRCDAFMQLVMEELGYDIPAWEGDDAVEWYDAKLQMDL